MIFCWLHKCIVRVNSEMGENNIKLCNHKPVPWLGQMGISLQQQSSQQPMDEDQPTKQGEKQNKKETKCTVQITRNNKQYKQLTDEHHKIRL